MGNQVSILKLGATGAPSNAMSPYAIVILADTGSESAYAEDRLWKNHPKYRQTRKSTK
jgi:hypothetical protein